MTKKQLKAIAEVIRILAWDMDKETHERVVDSFSWLCSKQNSRFNRERFVAACHNETHAAMLSRKSKNRE